MHRLFEQGLNFRVADCESKSNSLISKSDSGKTGLDSWVQVWTRTTSLLQPIATGNFVIIISFNILNFELCSGNE